MTERIKIITIDQPFLKILARYYFLKSKEKSPDFSTTLIIFPNERNKFYFRRYLLDNAMTGGIIPPTMFTIEEIVEYIYEKLGGEKGRILNSIERNFILKNTIDKLKIKFWRDLPFLRFISIGNRLLKFFDELSFECIKIEDIERKSRELHYAERYVKDELPILKNVYEEYRKELSCAGYKDRIDMIETIYNKYNSDLLKNFDDIIIAGIGATTSLEKMLIGRIMNELNAELIIHSGTPEEISFSNDVSKKFYLHNRLLKFLGVDIPKIQVIKGDFLVSPVIHIKSLESLAKQTFYLGDVVRAAIKRYEKPNRIAIILTSESLLFPVTEILKSLNIDYNLSAGFPFSNLIFYSFLQHLYNAVESNLHYEEFFVFLQHPLVKNARISDTELRPFVYELRNWMIKNKRNYFIENENPQLSLPNLESGNITLINFLKRCFSAVRADLKFNEYVVNLVKLLNEVLSYNQEIIRANPPGIIEFFEELHSLAQLRIPQDAIKPGIETLEFILRILKESYYRTEGEPFKGIQIIGVLEARNLDFDCIIIPSMNEGVFPSKTEKDIFINPALRKEMGLLTGQEHDNLYYYYFTELTGGKKEIFISYINEEKRDIPSRFITMLKFAGIPEDKAPILLSPSAIKWQERCVKKDKKIIKILLERIKRQGLSYSTLLAYKDCPYRFYLDFVLSIKKIEEIFEEFDARLWGVIFHKVVQEFYVKHYPQGFTEEEIADALRKFGEMFESLVFCGKYISIPPSSSVYFDLALYKIYIERFLKEEIKRFKAGYRIDIKSLEEKLTDEIEVLGNSIKLVGFVDRIDIKDGEYFIIDYKTGRLPMSKEYEIGEDFREFQLPLYALMFSRRNDKKIGGLIYYKIGKKVETKEILESEEVDDYLISFKTKILIPTIEEILNMEVPFYQTKDRSICEYCDYSALCGIQRYG